MELIQLTRTDEAEHYPTYDANHGFIIAAPSIEMARQLAATTQHGDEPGTVWLVPNYSTATVIGTAAPGIEQGILLADYNAG